MKYEAMSWRDSLVWLGTLYFTFGMGWGGGRGFGSRLSFSATFLCLCLFLVFGGVAGDMFTLGKIVGAFLFFFVSGCFLDCVVKFKVFFTFFFNCWCQCVRLVTGFCVYLVRVAVVW